MGDEFFDRPDVRERYRAHRERPDNPNDAIERPIFLRLAGELRGLDIVDLGCGDAGFGVEALAAGARSYTGVEVSEGMVALAREALAGRRDGSAEVLHLPIERWRPEEAVADLVASRLALNYVEDPAPVLAAAHRALRPGGRVVLTVEHPVITSDFSNLEDGPRTSWRVDGYFRPGPRTHRWLGREVRKFHRTIEEWLDLLRASGLHLEALRESRPERENFASEAEYRRRLRIPLFLFLAARKAPPRA